MSTSEAVIRVCAWIRMAMPGTPGFIGFTYVDREKGLSAKGGAEDDPDLAESPSMTLRLPWPGEAPDLLSEEEIRRRGLPWVPSWVEEFYAPQPMAGRAWGEWRLDPGLKDRFLPEFPDDLQVLIHDGNLRSTARQYEVAWVRVMGCDGEISHGRLLNRPKQLTTVSEGCEVAFVMPAGGEHPLMVIPKYLRERPDWTIGPCKKCGLVELFDAPSDLIRVVFPAMPPSASVAAFKIPCGACGGVQIVQHKGRPPEAVAQILRCDSCPAEIVHYGARVAQPDRLPPFLRRSGSPPESGSTVSPGLRRGRFEACRPLRLGFTSGASRSRTTTRRSPRRTGDGSGGSWKRRGDELPSGQVPRHPLGDRGRAGRPIYCRRSEDQDRACGGMGSMIPGRTIPSWR